MSPEINPESSTRYARDTTRAEWLWRIIAIALIGALLAMPMEVVADELASESTISFDIPQQRADLALTQFAEQANLTLLFPFDGVRDRTANALTGEYTLDEAIEALLAGTGLTPTFKNALVLDIAIDSDPTQDEDSMNTKKKAGVVAVLAGVLAGGVQAQEPTVTETKNQTSVVTGTVTDARTGRHLRGAKVTIEETGQWTSTGDLGRFRFSGVPQGEVTLSVSFLGYAGQSSVVSVDDADAAQDFALRGGDEIEEIVVFGQRSGRAQSLNLERTAPNTTTVLASDFLGQFQGATISDVLRRAPGVSFRESDVTGDGTNIIVRGLEPDLNTVTLNGVRLPDASGDGRSADLSSVLTDSIESVKINKSLLPSQDGSGTGGLIEIQTKGPLDRDALFLSFGIEGAVRADDFEEEFLVSGTASRIFGSSENLGLSASVQYREQSLENVSYFVTPDWGQYLPLNADGSVNTRSRPLPTENIRFPYAEGANQVFAQTTANDSGGSDTSNLTVNLSSQLQLGTHTDLRLDYTRLESDVDRTRRSFEMFAFTQYEALPVDDLGGEIRGALVWEDVLAPFGFPEGGLILASQNYAISNDESETDVVSFNGHTRSGRWEFDYSLGYTSGEANTPSNRRVEFERGFFDFIVPITDEFLLPEALNNTVDGRVVSPFGQLDSSGYPVPLFTEQGFQFANDPALWVLDDATDSVFFGRNERYSGSFDVNFSFETKYLDYVAVGGFYETTRFESGTATRRSAFGDGTNANDLGFSLSEGNLERIGIDGAFELIPISEIEEFWRTLSENPNATSSTGIVENITNGIFTDEENFAVYIEAGFSFGRLDVVGGLRFESVDVTARVERAPTVIREDGTVDREIAERFAGLVDQEGSNTEMLPRLLATYRVNDNLVVRAGYGKTVARPRVSDISADARITLNLVPVFGDGTQPLLQVFAANPNLEPALTDNYDFGVEYYFDDVGVLSASFFYKSMDNLPSTNQSVVGGVDQVELPDDPVFQELPENIFISGQVPVNSPYSAEIWGVELVAERQLTMLPAPFDGLGVFANYTYTDSSQKRELFYFDNSIGDFSSVVRESPFDDDVGESGTVGVSYNRSGIDASLAYTSQARRIVLWEQFGLSRYVDEDESLDFRAEYRFDDNWRVFVAGTDLLKGTSDPGILGTYGGEKGTPLVVSSGDYFGGRSFAIGIAATF